MLVRPCLIGAWMVALVALSLGACSPYDPGRLGGSGGSGGGGTGGAGTGGAGTGGACVPTSDVEDCDAVDDDCMGGPSMALNNGAAAESCRATILNATPRCSSGGSCLIGTCNPGAVNCDGEPSNGCEPCEDCREPEQFAACRDLDAGADDAGSDDAMISMPDGSTDAGPDAGPDAGQPCTPSNGGVEICDGLDNDCDGTTDTATPAVCPTNCTGHTTGGRVYVLCAMSTSPGSTWGYARGICRGATLMMDLVRINDATENAAVRAIAPTVRAWIGASDNNGVTMGPEGDWEWSDGTLFWRGAADGSAQGGLYANWAGNQPDNAGSGEGCAELLADGTWNDLPCGVGNNLAFLCEKP